jgi:hypothetical protein
MEPITIGIFITAGITVITLVLQFLQSAKIHDITISSCVENNKLNSSSSSSYKKKKKKKHKNMSSSSYSSI